MEIPGGHNYNFLMQNPVPKGSVDQFGVEISSRQNMFVTQPSVISDKNKGQKKQRKRSRKRLNALDNELLYSDEAGNYGQSQSENSDNFFMQSDFQMLFQSFLNTLKRIAGRLPIINFLIMQQKKEKLEKGIKDLSSINEDVDELINVAAPYGEQTQKYDVLCENIKKANEIHSKIVKEIQG